MNADHCCVMTHPSPQDWIPAATWRNVLSLADRLPAAFNDLPDSVARDDAAWRSWYDLEAPEAAPLPHYGARLTGLQRVCLVRAFREDRTLVAAADYIAAALGRQFVESVPASMERVWADSRPGCPIICLLSPGEHLHGKRQLRNASSQRHSPL